MKKLIALYKAFRGGEWFKASLESVHQHTDGAVVVIGTGAWTGEATVGNNCKQPLDDFQAEHPDYDIRTYYSESGAHSSDQYRIGLEIVRTVFGKDAAVLIVDTDEVWPEESLLALKQAIAENPGVQLFHGKLYSYVKSPLYRIWPDEKGCPPVALQTPVSDDLGRHNRFTGTGLTNFFVDDARFHHFTYVRNTDADLRLKFDTTSSQERYPSNPEWWDTVWPNLPEGWNLHMTRGCEDCWPEVKVLTLGQLPEHLREMPLVRQAIQREDISWRKRLRAAEPLETILPIPTPHDAEKYYADFSGFLTHVPSLDWFRANLKTAFLEALWLAYWASCVPRGGRILEIGCGSGGSTAILMLASDETVSLTAVDPFEPYDEEGTTGVVTGVNEGSLDDFRENAVFLDYQPRLIHLQVSSTVVRLIDRYDLAFVDGNHSREFVENDLRLAWNRLKPGGLLVGHDYTTRFPGVISAVDAWDVPVRTLAGTSLFYARKPME